MAVWYLQDAKIRFTDDMDATLAGEPQGMARRGPTLAVVVSMEDYGAVCRLEQVTFSSPNELLPRPS